MSQEPTRSRRGRPYVEPEEGRPNPLGLRVSAETKRKLDELARQAGKSQSQQAEQLFQEAFHQRDLTAWLFGSGSSMADVLIFRRYLEALKAATARAGDLPDECWHHAPTVGFPLDGWRNGALDSGSFDMATMAEKIRATVEHDLQQTMADVAQQGRPPALDTASRRPRGKADPDRYLAEVVDYRSRVLKCRERLDRLSRFEPEAELRQRYAPIYAVTDPEGEAAADDDGFELNPPPAPAAGGKVASASRSASEQMATARKAAAARRKAAGRAGD